MRKKLVIVFISILICLNINAFNFKSNDKYHSNELKLALNIGALYDFDHTIISNKLNGIKNNIGLNTGFLLGYDWGKHELSLLNSVNFIMVLDTAIKKPGKIHTHESDPLSTLIFTYLIGPNYTYNIKENLSFYFTLGYAFKAYSSVIDKDQTKYDIGLGGNIGFSYEFKKGFNFNTMIENNYYITNEYVTYPDFLSYDLKLILGISFSPFIM